MIKHLLLSIYLLIVFISCDDSLRLVQADENVAVSFSAIQSTTRSTSLATGTTVRVLVYRRSGTSADPSVDTYVTENTYVMGSDGNLNACITDDNGNKTSDTGSTMYLRSGTYDFYALTPAIKADTSTGGLVNLVSGIDYATSLTGNVSLNGTGTTQSVTLSTLDRKCAQLLFKIDRANTSVKSVIVDELTLSELSDEPLKGIVGSDLSYASANTGTMSLGSAAFIYNNTEPWKASASVIVLPKSNATYKLSITARFNGSNTAKTMTATIPAIAFEKGIQYMYTLQLYGDRMVLALTSASSDNWISPINLTIDAVGNGTLENLSMNSLGMIETANCYIVKAANQDYKFKATVMGNGMITPSSTCGDQIAPAIIPTSLFPVSAFVLWETGNKGDVIQDGSVKLISNGYLTFKTANNSTNGNAVIAITDGSNILWSWHIWKVNYDPDTDYDTYKKYDSASTFKMMRYNLGTTNFSAMGSMITVPGEVGLFYQWGRKDPFLGSTTWSEGIRLNSYNATGYEWKDGSNSSTAVANDQAIVSGLNIVDASIQYGKRYPTHYILNNSSTNDWLNASSYAEQRDNLWGNPNFTTEVFNTSAGTKSIYDPCPPGWRVPSQDYCRIFTSDGNSVSDINLINTTSSFNAGYLFYTTAFKSGTSTSFWPVPGYRSPWTGELMDLNGSPFSGSYWCTSSYAANSSYVSAWVFTESYAHPIIYRVRSFGFTIRCMKE